MESPSGPGQGVIRDQPKSPLILLQSLRFVAAMMVVSAHFANHVHRGHSFPDPGIFPQALNTGVAGVDIFFVISGFIMMHITPAAHRSVGDQGIFLARRFARIYPPYWTVALPLLFVWMWNPTIINSYPGNRVDVLGSLLLCPGHDPQVLLVAWTLVAEVSYYFVASFIFYSEGRTRLGFIVLWLMVIVVGRIVLPPPHGNPWIGAGLRTLTLEFIGGMFLAYFLKQGLPRVSPHLAAIVIALSFGAMIAWTVQVTDCDFVSESLARDAMYGVPAILIVWMVLQMDIQGEWRWWAKFAPLGDRSYAIYLLHFPIIAVVYRAVGFVLPHAALLATLFYAVGVAVILIPAVELLHRLVEKPSHEFARRAIAEIKGRKIVPVTTAK